MNWYSNLVKPLFFQFEPEKAHHLAIANLRVLLSLPGGKSLINLVLGDIPSSTPFELWGLKFKNRLGLAAGFDKDGLYMHEMAALGFGSLELGTVTPKPQPGNPKPRLFRLVEDQALINRMGFNNSGVHALCKQLEKKPDNVIIGGNIGKNKDTPNENAVDDYCYSFKMLADSVDYFVVNVSSPNTPGLRELQEREPLTRLLSQLQNLNQKLSTPKPLLLKIAPDVTEGQLDDILEIIQAVSLDGIIANNTTIDRQNLSISSMKLAQIGAGGLSGAPLRQKSNDLTNKIHTLTKGQLSIVGVGGILNAQDAKDRIDAGADIIQIYTGFIYQGPQIVRDILKILE